MEEKWPLTELMNLNVKNFENKDLLRLFFDRDKKKKKEEENISQFFVNSNFTYNSLIHVYNFVSGRKYKSIQSDGTLNLNFYAR